MPFILPLATALTAALTYETLKGTKKLLKEDKEGKKE